MAIEYFAADMIATAGEIAVDVASDIGNNLQNVAAQYEKRKGEQAAFERGVELARREWQPRYEEVYKNKSEAWSRAVSAGVKVADLQERLRNEVREKIFLDCQRFGYVQAIGMLKAFCDYTNRWTKDYLDRVVPFNKFLHHTGENVPLYEEITVTDVKLSDFPDINDEAHKHIYKSKLEEGHGVLSLYEECFLKGFWYRATQLWKKAEAENDTIALEAMQSLRTMKTRCFWQKPDDARELQDRQAEGYNDVNKRMIPYWDDEIERRTEFVKEHNLDSDDVVRMMGRYRNFEDKVREKIKEEKERYAEKGIDKTYFV